MNFIREFLRFVGTRKKLWLIPVFVVMLLVAGLFVFSQGSVLAPFIYTIF